MPSLPDVPRTDKQTRDTAVAALRIALFMLLLPVAQAHAHALTLKIATVAPDGTRWMQSMRAAAAEVEQRTESRVEVKFYPGAVMGNHRIVLRKIRIGQLHGGAFTGGELASVEHNLRIYPALFETVGPMCDTRHLCTHLGSGSVIN